ncbi:site-2 protease family protein [Candidatus Saccharibacteria bacterium]|nr:site-2 protease family protein [Candidatus Saccharibacteria bacterium]
MQNAVSLSGLAVFALFLFISISLHETMHAYIAYKLGDDLAHSRGRISLNPLRHIDPMLTIALPVFMILMGLPPILAAKPVPINVNRVSGDEMGLAAIGIAGPLTNLLLATIASIVLNGLSLNPGSIRDLFTLFIELNVRLFVFNMLPIPPLDGSRLLYALAPRSLQVLMEKMEQMGIFISIMIIFLLLSVLGPILINAGDFILNILIR